jgi:hypothetical protein
VAGRLHNDRGGALAGSLRLSKPWPNIEAPLWWSHV